MTSLRSLEAAGSLQRPIAAVASRVVHMFLNRIFSAAHRKQERVVYEFLCRLYEAIAARSRR